MKKNYCGKSSIIFEVTFIASLTNQGHSVLYETIK